MGSLSLFIDAGYLFKQGAGAVLDTKLGRHELLFDAKAFMTNLRAWVAGLYPEDELLRTYWYDGARQGVPTPDQLDVAALAFVKLRLGRINSAGQQKGVDTLMVRDLMVLSQERSIHRAIVLSGDEDLREGIEYAQDRGVRVAVVGIEANGDRNQSVELVREADENLVLPPELLKETLSKRQPATPAPTKAPATMAPSSTAGEQTAPTTDPAAVAEEFARDWLAKASAEDIAAIVAGRPKVPRTLDALMLQHAVQATGLHTIAEEPRRAMRAAFWRAIDAKTAT